MDIAFSEQDANSCWTESQSGPTGCGVTDVSITMAGIQHMEALTES